MKDTNLALNAKLRRGDVDKAFAEAAHVFEHEFRTQKCLHVAVRAVRLDRRRQGLRASRSIAARRDPRSCASEIARLLGWPENRVRIKVPYLGGGYGGKLYIKLEALVTACSLIARRPVKIALTMEEQFYQITKHPSTVRIKTGVDRSGRITGAQMRGVLERRRLRGYRPARDAQVGLHRRRPLRHRQRVDQLLRDVHQHDAGRRAARLRHAAAHLRL